jgi:putative molybdopterin biosynthesis protein
MVASINSTGSVNEGEDSMSIFLKDIPLAVAKNRLFSALEEQGLTGVKGHETIPLTEFASGRVLAEGVWAKISSPHYHSSAMDGFAVLANDTREALPSRPLKLVVGEKAFYVDTGDPLPKNTNAVIPIENVEPIYQDGTLEKDVRHPREILILSTVTPWSNIRLLGEDIVATQLVIPAGQQLRPFDLGAIAACGHSTIIVIRKPVVAIIPTGDELVDIGEGAKAGDIIEYNSMMIAAQVNSWGGAAKRYPIVKDNLDCLREAVIHAASHSDLILLNAGSSAGADDYSSQVVESLGQLLVHGVAVRPGHPVIIGMVNLTIKNQERHVPIIGVPGYPVSAALTCELFVEPLITMWAGITNKSIQEVDAELTHKVTSPSGDDDMMRVALGKVANRLMAAPLNRGAGVITSLVRADGISMIPRGIQGMEAGEKIRVRLYRSLSELDKTLFITGSHDLTLDVLAEYLAEKGHRLVTANVGSLGGLLALSKGEAHASGSHLLDPETGGYNDSYIRQYLSGRPINVMSWVGRIQGLLVQKGNPKKVMTLNDLTRPDIEFANRQRGAGTRVLLDYQLKKSGILNSNIRGYQNEEYTHLGVAAAVVSGRADCGLGITAAATALDLDFVPLFTETYEIVIPTGIFHSTLFEPVIQAANDQEFHIRVEKLPGYDTTHMGIIRSLS